MLTRASGIDPLSLLKLMREDTDVFDSLWWTYVEQEPMTTETHQAGGHRDRWAQES